MALRWSGSRVGIDVGKGMHEWVVDMGTRVRVVFFLDGLPPLSPHIVPRDPRSSFDLTTMCVRGGNVVVCLQI